MVRIVDVFLQSRRDGAAAKRFFKRRNNMRRQGCEIEECDGLHIGIQINGAGSTVH
jgi:hypothetical protein